MTPNQVEIQGLNFPENDTVQGGGGLGKLPGRGGQEERALKRSDPFGEWRSVREMGAKRRR